MEWLLKNKDWFFSGAGLAIISAVIYVIRRIYQWRTQRQGPATEATTTATIAGTRPYPSEITDAIRVSPALHQKTRGKEYVGLEVRWLCSLSSAIPGRRGGGILMLLDRGNYPWVNCAVDISKNPDLLQAKEGKRYWVQGKIISVSMGTIELGDVALYPA